jgi:phosphoserine aminotransferase
MNIPFRVKEDEALEKKFVSQATDSNLWDLKGHRSVGGCRASIYNAMPMDGVKALIKFMEEFKKANP